MLFILCSSEELLSVVLEIGFQGKHYLFISLTLPYKCSFIILLALNLFRLLPISNLVNKAAFGKEHLASLEL
jgi:hypothetical protein